MDNINVKIVGDGSDAIGASKLTAKEVAAASEFMQAKFVELGIKAKQSFDVVGDSSKVAAAEVRASSISIESSSNRMRAATDRVKAGLGSLVLGFTAFTGGALLVGGALLGVTNRALDHASALGEEAQQLGVTTNDLQIYRYAATQVGIAQEDMDRGLQKLTVTMGKAQAGAEGPQKTFKRLSDVLGRELVIAGRTAGDVLPDIAEALSKLPNPAERATFELELFGKSGQKLDTLLAGGRAEIDRLRDAAYSLGLVLEKDVIDNADQAADKLTEVKTVLEANIAGAVARNAQSIFQLANSFLALTQRALQLLAALQNFGALQIATGRTPMQGSRSDRREATNYLMQTDSGRSSLVGQFKSNIDNERAKLATDRRNFSIAQSESGKKFYQDRVAASEAFIARQQQAISAVQKLGSTLANVKPPVPAATPSVLGGGGGGGGGKGGSKAGGGSSAASNSMLSEWREQLDTMLLQSENFGKNENQLSIQFWEAKKQIARAGSRDMAEIDQELLRLNRREAEASHRKALELARDAAEIDRDSREAAIDASLAAIDAEEAEAAHRVDLGADTNARLIQQQLQFEERRATIIRQGLLAEIRVMTGNPNHDPVALAKLKNQLLEIERQYQARKRTIERAAESEATLRLRQGSQQVAASWGQSLARMLTLQQGFATTIKGLWQGIVGAVSGALAQLIEDYIKKWLLSLIVKRVAGAASNTAEVMSNAAVAGAGGTASMAAAPFPLNLTAPAFGAAMSAAAMAYAPMASAAGGYDIPGGVNPVTQLHQREMVLPAELADRVRGMTGGASGGREGDLHMHVNAMDARSFRDFVLANKREIADALRSAYRDGSR